jgi:ribonuclease R
MIGDRTGTTYRLGDRLTVRLLEAAPLTGGLRFEITDMGADEEVSRPRPQIKTQPKPRTEKRGKARNGKRSRPR